MDHARHYCAHVCRSELQGLEEARQRDALGVGEACADLVPDERACRQPSVIPHQRQQFEVGCKPGPCGKQLGLGDVVQSDTIAVRSVIEFGSIPDGNGARRATDGACIGNDQVEALIA